MLKKLKELLKKVFGKKEVESVKVETKDNVTPKQTAIFRRLLNSQQRVCMITKRERSYIDLSFFFEGLSQFVNEVEKFVFRVESMFRFFFVFFRRSDDYEPDCFSFFSV